MTETTANLLKRRTGLLGPNVSTFYDDPVHLVRGEGVWVWDAEGKKYLDYFLIHMTSHIIHQLLQA